MAGEADVMGDKAAGSDMTANEMIGAEMIGGGGVNGGGASRAPKAVTRALTGLLVALVAIAVYLIAVRREALFVDLAGISGMLFCF